MGLDSNPMNVCSQRSQPRRISSYTSARRTCEPWKKTNPKKFEDQNTRTYSQVHSQGQRKEVDLRSYGRCWSCNKFGHKAQNCWNDMRRLTYSLAKKTNKDIGENNEKIDAKKHLWMKKNSVLNEIEDQCTTENGCHMASHSWSLINDFKNSMSSSLENGLKW